MDQQPEEARRPIDELENERREKREAIRALGLDPYGGRIEGLLSLQRAFESYDESVDQRMNEAGIKPGHEGDERPVVRVAGRVMLARDNGRLVWMNLRDATRESLQVAVSKRDCNEVGFQVAKKTDLGDIVVAEGPLTRTRTGEVTVWARSIRPASKALLPPPEKHAGLQNPEARYRRRYVDMWSNPRTTRTLLLRSRLVSGIRRLMEDRGFVEVETPMLQVQAGGAAARPFVTHMNALNIDLYLRIAPELYLKRLLVGGLPRVFELNRNFRNEGVDRRHNPEFTAIEVYEAFGDVHSMMELTEAIVRECARIANESEGREGFVRSFGDLEIDYDGPFERFSYGELFERAFGFSMEDEERVRAEGERRGVRTKDDRGEPLDVVWIVNELFEAHGEGLIDPARPTWVMRYPSALSPLTRPCADDPRFADRADLFIAGMEIGPHYTELNDPDVQAEKFREQLAGIDEEESTFRSFDEDFVRALKVGMPPAGGMGLGIDRLVMLMADEGSIRDVIAFPFMRPQSGR